MAWTPIFASDERVANGCRRISAHSRWQKLYRSNRLASTPRLL